MIQPPDPALLPCGPLEETAGLMYFPRMVGKIRLHAAGRLWEDLHARTIARYIDVDEGRRP